MWLGDLGRGLEGTWAGVRTPVRGRRGSAHKMSKCIYSHTEGLVGGRSPGLRQEAKTVVGFVLSDAAPLGVSSGPVGGERLLYR